MLDSLDTLIAFALIFTVVSLLVTILVQIMLSLFDLRGKNLVWAVAETFAAIEPKLAAEVKTEVIDKAKTKVKGAGLQLAEAVLKDPLLSDRQWGKNVAPATAVRLEELFDVLYRIATGKKDPAANATEEEKKAAAALKDNVHALFKQLGVDLSAAPDSIPDALKEKLKSLSDLVAALPDGEARTKAIAALQAMGDTATAAAIAKEKLQIGYQKFEAWLDTGQERAQDWFRLHARFVTFGIAILFAFVLQLDAIEIFRTVSTNKAVRDKLVAYSGAVVEQGEKILSTRADAMQAALAGWKAEIAGGSNEALKLIAAAGDLKVDAGKETRSSLRRKVEARLAPPLDKTAAENALQALDKAMDAAVAESLEGPVADYKLMKQDVAGTGFELFPHNGWRWKGKKDADGEPEYFLPHVPGILTSILLLSLGAPFWFNLLKGLANLRSTVASNIATEDKADEKHGANPPAGIPPSNVVPPGGQVLLRS